MSCFKGFRKNKNSYTFAHPYLVDEGRGKYNSYENVNIFADSQRSDEDKENQNVLRNTPVNIQNNQQNHENGIDHHEAVRDRQIVEEISEQKAQVSHSEPAYDEQNDEHENEVTVEKVEIVEVKKEIYVPDDIDEKNDKESDTGSVSSKSDHVEYVQQTNEDDTVSIASSKGLDNEKPDKPDKTPDKPEEEEAIKPNVHFQLEHNRDFEAPESPYTSDFRLNEDKGVITISTVETTETVPSVPAEQEAEVSQQEVESEEQMTVTASPGDEQMVPDKQQVRDSEENSSEDEEVVVTEEWVVQTKVVKDQNVSALATTLDEEENVPTLATTLEEEDNVGNEEVEFHHTSVVVNDNTEMDLPADVEAAASKDYSYSPPASPTKNWGNSEPLM